MGSGVRNTTTRATSITVVFFICPRPAPSPSSKAPNATTRHKPVFSQTQVIDKTFGHSKYYTVFGTSTVTRPVISASATSQAGERRNPATKTAIPVTRCRHRRNIKSFNTYPSLASSFDTLAHQCCRISSRYRATCRQFQQAWLRSYIPPQWWHMCDFDKRKWKC